MRLLLVLFVKHVCNCSVTREGPYSEAYSVTTDTISGCCNQRCEPLCVSDAGLEGCSRRIVLQAAALQPQNRLLIITLVTSVGLLQLSGGPVHCKRKQNLKPGTDCLA
jgi:hypothetical protein